MAGTLGGCCAVQFSQLRGARIQLRQLNDLVRNFFTPDTNKAHESTECDSHDSLQKKGDFHMSLLWHPTLEISTSNCSHLNRKRGLSLYWTTLVLYDTSTWRLMYIFRASIHPAARNKGPCKCVLAPVQQRWSYFSLPAQVIRGPM